MAQMSPPTWCVVFLSRDLIGLVQKGKDNHFRGPLILRHNLTAGRNLRRYTLTALIYLGFGHSGRQHFQDPPVRFHGSWEGKCSEHNSPKSTFQTERHHDGHECAGVGFHPGFGFGPVQGLDNGILQVVFVFRTIFLKGPSFCQVPS